MFKTILVPTDGSALSDKVIDAAVDAAKNNGGKIVALSVADPYPFSAWMEGSSRVMSDSTTYEEKTRERAQQHLQKIVAAASAANVPCQTIVPLSFDPS